MRCHQTRTLNAIEEQLARLLEYGNRIGVDNHWQLLAQRRRGPLPRRNVDPVPRPDQASGYSLVFNDLYKSAGISDWMDNRTRKTEPINNPQTPLGPQP